MTDIDSDNKLYNTFDITLAEAIITQACVDYRAALRGNCRYPRQTISEIMRFFTSEWYELLTDVDWHLLVEKLHKDYEDGQWLINAGVRIECPKPNHPYKFKCPLCGGEAEVRERLRKGRKDENGTRHITYYREFSCSCHSAERIIIREVNENA